MKTRHRNEIEEAVVSHPSGLERATGSETEETPNAEALIKEARRRQRRRYAFSAAVVVVVAGLVVGLLLSVGGSDTTPTKSVPSAPRVSIQSLTFPGPFVPEQVVSASGAVWVLGTSQPTLQGGCSIEEVDPVSLRKQDFPIPACGYYLTVGKGLVYIAADIPSGYGDDVHLEIFNPVTRHATVMAPVIITTQGSGRAHMDMTYGTGSIWMTYWGRELVEISPSTGAVIKRITNAPPSVGGHGTIIANEGGLWIAEGAGSSADIYRLAPGSQAISKIYSAPARESVLWLSSIGTRIWADVASYSQNSQAVSTKLIAFDLSGRKVLQTPNEQFGDVPLVGQENQLWSVGSGAQCSVPQRLWMIDAATGRSSEVTTLRTPVEPCLTESPTTSQMTVVDRTVFVLEATGTTRPAAVMYRVHAE
jgi:hypothetical protein